MVNPIDAFIQRDPLWNHSIRGDLTLCGILVPIWEEARAAMSFHEMVNLYRFAKKTVSLPGDIAELGVFKGGSAKLMARTVGGSKTIHLFDTFTGLPEVTLGEDPLAIGDLSHPFEEVRQYLMEFPNIRFYKGMFPDTAKELGNSSTQFCLVNLDADTYRSTLNALEFFYPRMVKRGIICMHDYQSVSCPGVKKAVDEFFADKPEILFELWHTQVAFSKD